MTDRLLGGRVLLDQGEAGLRAAIDPVLLAAAVPAREGEAVLEAGTGIGTAALCLLSRLPGVRVVGVEQDGAQAERAAANAALNGWAERFTAITGDIGDAATSRAVASHGPFTHAMANPPWFAGGTPPPGQQRRLAKHSGAASLAPWVGFLTRRLAPRGTLSLILPPALLSEALAALAAARVGDVAVLPLWPHAGEAAKRLIIAGRKDARGALRLLPGLVLHEKGGQYTPAAEAILREGAALTLR